MYCSIEEAWPGYYSNKIKEDLNEPFLNKNISEIPMRINNKPKVTTKVATNVRENVQQHNDVHDSAHIDNLKITTHQNILDHIHNCDYCLKEIYKRYNCMGSIDKNYLNNFNNFNMDTLLSKENKEIITIMLLGMLVMLILQLFKH